LLALLAAALVWCGVGSGDGFDHRLLQFLCIMLTAMWRAWTPNASRWHLQHPATGTCIENLLDRPRGIEPRFTRASVSKLVRNGLYKLELIDPAQAPVKRLEKAVGSCDFAVSYLPAAWAVQLDTLGTVGYDDSPSIGVQLPAVSGVDHCAGSVQGERAFKPRRGPRRDLEHEWRPSRAVAREIAGGSALACPSLLMPLVLLVLLLLKAASLAGGTMWGISCLACIVYWRAQGGPVVHVTEAGPS
jgi:hypothetical protein